MSRAEAFLKSLYGRPATVKTKTSLFNNHVKPYLTYKAPVEAVHAACRGWREDDLSIGTIKGCMVLLAEYMKFTYGYELDKKRLMYDYTSDMTRAPARVKVWTKDQVKHALLTAAINVPELFKVMLMALGTGMRRGEIFGLQWEDINFMDSTITVSRSRDIASGAIGPTKTKTSRVIQMSDQVAKMLEKSYNVGDTGFVFPDYFDPTPLMADLAFMTNLPEITFHDLRHTFATTCLENGMSPKWVSATLGHAKLTTTMDLYWQHFQEKVDMESIYE